MNEERTKVYVPVRADFREDGVMLNQHIPEIRSYKAVTDIQTYIELAEGQQNK